MITLQHNQEYITKNDRRVRVERREGVPEWHPYKFYAYDAINGNRWSCTAFGREYDDRPSTNDIIRKVDTNQTSEGDSNVNTSNLGNLKAKSDKARQEYVDSLKALQDSLPEGVKLMVDGEEFDGTNAGSVPSETLITITKKSDVKVGDILRLVDAVQHEHTERRLVEQGKDYRVVHIDGFNDPHVVDANNAGRRIDTCGMLMSFRIVRTQNQSEGTWIPLTRDNRNQLQVGSKVRGTAVAQHATMFITAGTEYEIFSKPDRDARFRDDRGRTRDTCGLYDGELEMKIS